MQSGGIQQYLLQLFEIVLSLQASGERERKFAMALAFLYILTPEHCS